ncbi:ACT domain-containing protein ACR2 [Rhodamnia argentea]|uniref:ACT domain-containing protein ACR n=1 Tax=Rhodamnia argentea TaxID=178133 RepID=A0A8B8MY58_9MYRT|nr:ACT domain-containing protein ACR2 [Rhodamnia argentea]XP_048134106.1 ACT domain-containing protein ACR2 [Rhodamnia argentea]
MQKVCWPYFDPDFENLRERIYGPTCRVSIDNESMEDCTVIKVDSVNKQGLLLEMVQVLTDMNLSISKSYISSDGGWNMDVFHVKDEHGNKIRDQRVIDYIQQAIDTTRETLSSSSLSSPKAKAKVYTNSTLLSSDHYNEHTAIEMTGTDRPGLFSEISAALADLHCNIIKVHAWSHNTRLACVAYVSDQRTDTPIEDRSRLATIEDHLTMVLRAQPTTGSQRATPPNQQEVKASDLQGGEGTMTNVERRLHQLMLSVRDFDEPASESSSSPMMPMGLGPDRNGQNPRISIEEWNEKGYSAVNIKCKDRRRLMFDTVCTLTDMQYVIFHASACARAGYAYQEYFIRHIDGSALSTEGEKERVMKCLEAAIERRVCEGFRLELCANNRIGLLSDITRVLRENGLAVVRADVETQGEKAVNAFYLKDISGNEVDMEFVERIKREMGPIMLAVKDETRRQSSSEKPTMPFPSLGGFLKSRIERLSHNFVTIK